MKNLLRAIVSLALLLPLIAQAPHALGADIAPCRIAASVNQTVSLGFPLRKERLANITKPKILVIPFKQKDNPNYDFVDWMKKDYLTASSNIRAFSNGQSEVEFIFAPVIQTELTNSDMDQLKINQREQFQKDESKSTYGWVRKFIADNDSRINYSGIDAVIIEGSSTSPSSDIAEAFMFWSQPQNPWFRPIETAEGLINNAVLLDNHSSQETITHEIMHLYGMQDLYGTNTGPGELSLMASNSVNLLSYEKWILGWLPNESVQCISDIDSSPILKIEINLEKTNQIVVIRSKAGGDYIADITKLANNIYLALYSINNDDRPPLRLFQERNNSRNVQIDISNYKSMGSLIDSPSFSLLVSNFDASKLTLQVASSKLINSSEFNDLIKLSANRKIEIENLQKAKIQEEADLKAKLEAEKKEQERIQAALAQKAKEDEIARLADAQKKQEALRKITITCIKGKLIKKITSTSPKCPTGYKKK